MKSRPRSRLELFVETSTRKEPSTSEK